MFAVFCRQRITGITSRRAAAGEDARVTATGRSD
jgi:hypothetical protein